MIEDEGESDCQLAFSVLLSYSLNLSVLIQSVSYLLLMRLVYFLFLIFILPSQFSLPTLQALPYPYWQESHKTLPLHPKAVWKELNNGLTYVILPCKEPPEKVSIQLYVAAGSLMEEASEQGLAHFLEHLAFRGSTHFPEGTVTYLQKLGSSFGPDINASTSFFETIYQLEIPENDEASLHTALLAMQDYAFGAKLEEAVVDAERAVVLAEEKASDTVGYRAQKKLLGFATEGSLLPERFPIGKTDVLQDLKAEDIQRFYKQWYQPQRMVLVIAGDIQVEAVSAKIQELFASFPRGKNLKEPFLGKRIPRGTAAYVHQDPELTQTELILMVGHPHGFGPYTEESFRDDLYEGILSDIFCTRLKKVQKQEGVPFSLSGVSSFALEDFSKLYTLSATIPQGQWASALRLLQQHLQTFLAQGPQASELEQAKKRVLRTWEESIKREETYTANDWCRGLIASICNKQPFISLQLGFELAEQFLEAFTPEFALSLLQNFLDEADRFIFIRTPEAISKEEVLQAYEEATRLPILDHPCSTVSELNYTVFEKPGAVKSQKYIQDLGIQSIDFANNVHAKLKVTDFEKEAVYITLRFGGGLLAEPKDKRGLALLAESAFLPGGLKHHSVDDIVELLAGKVIDLHFSVGGDAFYLTAHSSKNDAEEACQLLLAYMTDPGYREEALRQVHKNIEAVYKYSTQTPEGVLGNAGSKLLAGGDERFALPEYEKFMLLTMQDVQAWLEKPLRQSLLEVSVVGDFDLGSMEATLARTVGALAKRDKTKPSYTKERKLSFPRETKRAELPFKSELDRAFVSINWPTSDARKPKRVRRLAVLAEVFRNKMLKTVREEQGLSYSPSAGAHMSLVFPDYGYFSAGTLAETKHMPALVQSIICIAEDLAQNGVSQEDFDLAMQPILKNLKNDLRDNGYWMNSVLSGSYERPMQLEWCRNRTQDIASITPKDLQDLAKKYLSPNKALQLFVIPRKSEDGPTK